MDNESELLKHAIQDLAEAILAGEYGKDRRNVTELHLLSEGRFQEYLRLKSGEPSY